MDTILVAGVDGMVGANFAASLSGLQPVVGAALDSESYLNGCETHHVPGANPEAIDKLVRQIGPQRIVYCGQGAKSCWAGESSSITAEHARALAWLRAANSVSAKFTLISSDAVFTGPWMFHSENSQSFCDSAEAVMLRQIESAVETQRPDALILRTHAYGWSPTIASGRSGWLESLLQQMQSGQSVQLSCVCHASPILATDLAAVVQKAWQCGLTGIYHIAGAERVNPLQFARQLALNFATPFVHVAPTEVLSDRAVGFGRGETSLQTRKIRRALGIGLPLLGEGLGRLYQQHASGERDRLQGSSAARVSRVA